MKFNAGMNEVFPAFLTTTTVVYFFVDGRWSLAP
jgi:hypothetical protein